jgi:cysteine synthase
LLFIRDLWLVASLGSAVKKQTIHMAKEIACKVETGRVCRAGGSGEDFVPPNTDLSLIRQACAVSDQDSFATARDLLRHEGVLAGSSTRTLLAAALRYCREQEQPQWSWRQVRCCRTAETVTGRYWSGSVRDASMRLQ